MKRSKFSLSHHKLLTGNMGWLIPCTWFEALPGDSIQHQTQTLVRTAPLLAPMMSMVDIRVHHWFVPNRLLWQDWEDFITGGEDGDNAAIPPYRLTGAGTTVGTLGDYLGVPTGITGVQFSALPYRAYAMIWNEWYRDQDLQDPLTIDLTDGQDTTTNAILQNISWEKDRFTSARPWAQKGPSVTIPLGSTAPVVSDGTTPEMVASSGGTAGTLDIPSAGANQNIRFAGNPPSSGALDWDNTGLEVDLTSAVAADINALREAFALQRYAEARARYGSRYTEYLRYLGVRSSDARLQRPEYLGGGRQRLQVSEVLQTGVTTDGDDTEGVGNLKGHGIGAMRSNRYRRFFEEHGIVMSLLSIKPRTVYANGVTKAAIRQTREDYWQKELEHIGQEEIRKCEVYAQGTAGGAADFETWGYQDRYDEYRRIENSIAGEFRSTLSYWHMARLFTSLPSLNGDFVESNPTDRVYASGSTQHQLQVMVNHSIQARRMVSKIGRSFIY